MYLKPVKVRFLPNDNLAITGNNNISPFFDYLIVFDMSHLVIR